MSDNVPTIIQPTRHTNSTLSKLVMCGPAWLGAFEASEPGPTESQPSLTLVRAQEGLKPQGQGEIFPSLQPGLEPWPSALQMIWKLRDYCWRSVLSEIMLPIVDEANFALAITKDVEHALIL
ncbi:hypothetical protein BDP27DRAFT_1371831 [Rhodocollybia butyracea]|uniref:Uncharacterized protein n=1 Tax=Rhodocollybia butyracea TaxID=206335 RepID=A0A9P5P8Z1_9AGAR|nr:hypothetical protein BDP27DRAFT_1371831 [Rhodocollybia butyracea]